MTTSSEFPRPMPIAPWDGSRTTGFRPSGLGEKEGPFIALSPDAFRVIVQGVLSALAPFGPWDGPPHARPGVALFDLYARSMDGLSWIFEVKSGRRIDPKELTARVLENLQREPTPPPFGLCVVVSVGLSPREREMLFRPEFVAAQDGIPTPKELVIIDAEDLARMVRALPPEAWQAILPRVAATDDQRGVLAALHAEPLAPADQVAAAAPDRRIALDPASPLVARYANEQDTADRLGIAHEVEAIARTLVSSAVRPPLSVGLFGDWGAGKTFFVDRLHERIDALAEQARGARERATWHGDVAQIRFNAWHYSDAELWPSLVAHLFEELARKLSPEQQSVGRAELLDALEIARSALAEAEALKSRAEAERTAASDEVEKATAERKSRADSLAKVRARDILALLEQSPEAAEAIAGLRSFRDKLGLSTLLAEGVSLENDLVQLRGENAQLRAAVTQVLTGEGSGLRIAKLVLLGLVVPVGGYLVRVGLEALQDSSIVTSIGALAAQGACLVAGASAFVGQTAKLIRDTNNKLNGWVRQIDTVRRAHVEERTSEEAKLDASLRAAEFVEAEARRRLGEAERQVTAAETALKATNADQLLRAFVEERSTSGDYGARRGLVAMVHRDFKELGARLAKIADNRPENKVNRISRIVLYIDDLDRCSPRHVVEVLQAVHLMLAFELFVVVVAVDTRWLMRALEKRYDGLLGGSAPGHDPGAATPEDYLEKIFQIPFQIRSLDEAGYRALIESLCSVPETASIEVAPTALLVDGDNMADRRTSTPLAAPVTVAPRDAPMRDASDVLLPQVLPLDAIERAFLQRLHPLVDTPRSAKRLVNVYHLARTMDELGRRESGRGPRTAQARNAMALLLAFQGLEGRHAGELTLAIGGVGPMPWTEFADRLCPRAQVRFRDGGDRQVRLDDPEWTFHASGHLVRASADVHSSEVVSFDNIVATRLTSQDVQVWMRLFKCVSGLGFATFPDRCDEWTPFLELVSRFCFYSASAR